VEKTITIFGTWWCGDCLRTRRYFNRNQIIYKWVDIDQDEVGEEFVLSTNNGMRSVPTIVFSDGSILVEPSDTELQLKLENVLKSS
jgi:glutaredoxin-like protein